MRRYSTLLLLLFFSPILFTQEDTTKKVNDLSDLSLEELLNLKVYSASKSSESVKEAPAIISLITSEDIKNTAALTIVDVLKYIPCLEVAMGSDGNYTLALRGSRKEGNILVLINGQQLNGFYSGRVFYDLPASFIEKIEVIRGPGSALYGTNALSGVINIFTKKDNNVSLSIGPLLNVNVNTNFYVKKENNEFAFSMGYAQNNTNNREITQDKAVNESWSLTNGDKVYKTNRWNNDLYFNSSVKHGNLHFNAFNFYRQQGAYVGPTYIAGPDSKFIKNQLLTTLYYDYQVGDNVTITPKVYSQYNNISSLQQEAPDGYISVTSGDTFANGKLTKEQYQGTLFGGEVTIKIKANEHFDFLTGTVYEDLKMNSYNLSRNYQIVGDIYKTSFSNYDNIPFDQNGKRRMVFAYFAQAMFKYDNLKITTGLRYDDYNDFGQALNPRIGVTYELNEHFRLKGLYGKAFRAPTFSELYDNTTLGNEYGVKGNTNLSNESINTYELGSELNTKRFILRYNIYHIRNVNLIRIYDSHGGGSIGLYENIGNTSLYGHEAELIFKLNSFLQFNANFSQFVNYFEYNKDKVSPADYQFFEKQAKYNQELRNTPTIRVNTSLQINVKKFNLFMGSSFGNACENNKRFFLEKNHYAKIGYYLLGNFNLAYNFSEKFRMSLSANNIGTKYSDPEESTNINAFGEEGLLQPGPMYLLNINYSFK